LEVGSLGFNLDEFIKTVGYLGVFGIVFAESGLLIGILFPGDSLLFTAGFLASEGYLSLPVLVVVAVVAAIAGDTVGYLFGMRVGRKLYERPDSRFFKQQHLRTAEAFYERHGGKAIILARFMPIVRTLAPVLAGVSAMHYRRFVMFNVVGGVLWGAGLAIGGYMLGSTIPNVDRYLLPIIFVIIVVSAAPSLIHLYANHRAEIWDAIRNRGRRRSAPDAEAESHQQRHGTAGGG
jgi:membrane-associated protein